MLDLSSFAELLTHADPRLRPRPGMPPSPLTATRRGVRWWLVHEDVEPEDVLARVVATYQQNGWRRLAQEKLNFLLGGDRGKLMVHIDDAPHRVVVRRTVGGEEHRAPLWPEDFAGRVIVRVEVI
jgi:hypothetical protein